LRLFLKLALETTTGQVKAMSGIVESGGKQRKAMGRVTARNAALMNLFATPGLGSMVAGRVWAGTGQLVLAVAGFTLVVIWFISVMAQLYAQIGGADVSSSSYGRVGLGGAILFAAAWLWSLGTSLNLLREARRNESGASNPGL
jgi:hypothetical protein